METMRERLLNLLDFEALILLSLIGIAAFGFYKIFLRKLSQDRHENLRGLFRELWITQLFFWVSWFLQYAIVRGWIPLAAFYNYFGLVTVISGAVLFVRAVKIMVFEYLFFKSGKVGVPLLLVSLVTLIISIFIAAWLSTSVFGVRWAPLLATSAFVSVVLGLALQDTLGNLFAGVALQFDKPYELGDWIEVKTGTAVFTGEVHEISWRATLLYGLLDEEITLPNRLVAQSEISNFSARKRPIYRAISVHLDASADEQQVKSIFEKVLKQTRGIIQHLDHYVMLRDLSEKGAHWRIVYPVAHFDKQFTVVDGILMGVQAELKKTNIAISRFRVDAGLNARHESSQL